MAFEAAPTLVTLPATTGLGQYTLVTVNTAGKIAAPTLGGRFVGVLVDGTTGSTAKKYATVQIGGIAKVKAAGGTLAVGASYSASAAGLAKATTGTAFVGGLVVDGSSGSTGRILSVSLTR